MVLGEAVEEAGDGLGDFDVGFLERAGQRDVFDGGTAAEGDVGLSGGEGAALQIDMDFVDGFALRFVNGGRPREI